MVEVLACASDEAAFKSASKATGFSDDVMDKNTGAKTGEKVRTGGTWEGLEGAWALNIVGKVYVATGKMVDAVGPGGETIQVPEMAARPGEWARLRWNQSSNLERLAAFIAALRAQGLTVWELLPLGEKGEFGNAMCWSSDGKTCDADQTIDEIGRML